MDTRPAVLFLLLGLAAVGQCDVTVNGTTIGSWLGGFEAKVCFNITKPLNGWRVNLYFDQPITSLESWVADVSAILDGGKEYVLVNKFWNANLTLGNVMCINFIGHGAGFVIPAIRASMPELPGGGNFTVKMAPVEVAAQYPAVFPPQYPAQYPAQVPAQYPFPAGFPAAGFPGYPAMFPTQPPTTPTPSPTPIWWKYVLGKGTGKSKKKSSSSSD